MADADGIIVVPLKDAPEVLEAAKKFHEQDAAKVEAARNGTSNRAWVRKKLEEKKTEFIDGMYRGISRGSHQIFLRSGRT